MPSHPTQLDIEIPGLDCQFIAGQWQTNNNTRRIDVISPTTEEIITTVAAVTLADADAAATAARRAFDSGPWPIMDITDRVAVCARLCDAMESRLDALNRAWTFESGPTIAHGETRECGAEGILEFTQIKQVMSGASYLGT